MEQDEPEVAKMRVFKAATAVGEGHEIVMFLREFPDGASFSQIATRTKLNSNTLTRKLWGLIENGIVERKVVVPDENRRYSFYRLTVQGERFVEKMEELNVFRPQQNDYAQTHKMYK